MVPVPDDDARTVNWSYNSIVRIKDQSKIKLQKAEMCWLRDKSSNSLERRKTCSHESGPPESGAQVERDH